MSVLRKIIALTNKSYNNFKKGQLICYFYNVCLKQLDWVKTQDSFSNKKKTTYPDLDCPKLTIRSIWSVLSSIPICKGKDAGIEPQYTYLRVKTN